MKCLIASTILLAAMSACHPVPRPVLDPPSTPREVAGGPVRYGPLIAAEFNQSIAQRGKLTFLSFNGRWVGMDADTYLSFMPDGKAVMEECGVGVQDYEGTYQIDGDGIIKMNFDRFRSSLAADAPRPGQTLALARAAQGE